MDSIKVSSGKQPLLPTKECNHGGGSRAASVKKICEVALADFAAAALAVVFVVANTIGYAGIIAAGAGLSNQFGALVQQTIYSQAAGAFVFAWSGYRTFGAIDPLVGNFMAQCGTITQAKLPGADTDVQAVHAMLLMIVFTFGFGVLTYVLGHLRSGIALKFIPFTVTSGLLGGFGLIVVHSSLEFAIAVPLSSFPMPTLWDNGLALIRTAAMLTVMAMAMYRRDHPLAKPIAMIVGTVIFHVLPFDLQADQNWLLPINKDATVNVLGPWSSLHLLLANFHARAIFNADAARLFFTFFGVIFVDWGAHIPAIGNIIKKRKKIIDVDREIQIVGVCSMVMGVIGGQPISHAVLIPLGVQSVGKEYWVPMMTAMLIVVTATSGWTVATFIPRFVFAGTMIQTGVELVVEFIIESRHRIAEPEWRVLVLTAVIIWYDALLGLLVGLLLALAFFMMEYTGLSGVKGRASLRTIRSAVERTPEEEEVLKEHADEVVIFWMHGYLFFGSIAKATDQVRAAAAAGARWIVVDLSLVPAIDAAGVHGLVDIAKEVEADGATLILTGMVRRLGLAVKNAGDAVSAATLDFGLEHIENTILRSFPCDHSPLPSTDSIDKAWAIASRRVYGEAGAPAGLGATPWRKVAAVSALRTEAAGILYAEGSVAGELLVLLRGQVHIERNPPDASQNFLPRWHLNEEKNDQFVFEDYQQRLLVTSRPGTVLNPMECAHAMAGREASARSTARASTEVLLLSVPFSAFSNEVSQGFFREFVLMSISHYIDPSPMTHMAPQVAPLAPLADLIASDCISAPLSLSRKATVDMEDV
eukprot:TRINITY_DN5158_c0_g1_i9.p1 TRINITY_DN5158_c0_g1~~TRINITY_DN5158_c0_g1_i9.p1  ORF type:complete len:815 (+),score=123.69 TRINITY_DN5158_c0_g1_i9:57-2501(+)